MLGLGLGVWAPSFYSSGPFKISFGVLTRAGAGGVEFADTSIVSGDPSGHFQIVGGRITPTAAGFSAGLDEAPYSVVGSEGATISIEVVPGEASVRTAVEAHAASSDLSGGYVIKFRAETIDVGSLSPRLFKNRSYADAITLTGEPGHLLYGKLAAETFTNVIFEGLAFTYDDTGAMLNLFGVSSGTIRGCSFLGGDTDLNGDWYATGSPNPDAISTVGGSAGHSFTGTIEQNLARFVRKGITILSDNQPLEITDNEIEGCYEDTIKVTLAVSHTAPLNVSRNVCYNFTGDPADASNPHVDVFQILGRNAGTLEDVTIEQNVAWVNHSAARGRSIQGLVSFTDSTGPKAITATVRGNLMLLDSAHGITFNSVDGGSYENNVCVNPTETISRPGISLGVDASAGTVYVDDSVLNLLSLQGSATYHQSGNEIVLPADYSTVFEGPVFAPVTFDEAISVYSSLPGQPGAIPVFSFGQPRDPEGWSSASEG